MMAWLGGSLARGESVFDFPEGFPWAKIHTLAPVRETVSLAEAGGNYIVAIGGLNLFVGIGVGLSPWEKDVALLGLCGEISCQKLCLRVSCVHEKHERYVSLPTDSWGYEPVDS
jgi:hypothetical protein